MTNRGSLGPDPEAVTRYVTDTFPGVDVVIALNATFFSLDPDKHWPNFATIVTTDEHDMGSPSNLTARPNVFRLNIGVSRMTFERLAGGVSDPGYAALDRILPHPVYAKQLWVSILNPSAETFEAVVKPLLKEAHDRIAASRARHRAAPESPGARTLPL